MSRSPATGAAGFHFRHRGGVPAANVGMVRVHIFRLLHQRLGAMIGKTVNGNQPSAATLIVFEVTP